MTAEKRKALLAHGYAEFRCSAPGFEPEAVLAPDARVAADKYRRLRGVPAHVPVAAERAGGA